MALREDKELARLVSSLVDPLKPRWQTELTAGNICSLSTPRCRRVPYQSAKQSDLFTSTC